MGHKVEVTKEKDAEYKRLAERRRALEWFLAEVIGMEEELADEWAQKVIDAYARCQDAAKGDTKKRGEQ